jgi:hypothetical protein
MATTRTLHSGGQAAAERLTPSLEDEVRRSCEQIMELVSELMARLDAVRTRGDRHLHVVPARDTGGVAEPLPRPIGGGGELRFEALGRDRALARVNGREAVLSRRHSEIVVLLAAYPAGMTTEQLTLAVYGEPGKPQTARAEVSRLRRLLGARLETEPYRLAADVQSDVADVRQLLRDGQAGEAAALYRGPLLPSSDAPGVVDLRNELDGWTRRAALTSDDNEALWSWLNTPSGEDDIQAWKRLLSSIPHADGRRALAAARLERLRPLFATAEASG